MNFQYVITDRSITIVIDGQPYHVPRPDDVKKGKNLWDQIKKAISDPSTTKEQMLALVNPAITIENASKNIDGIRIYNGELFFNGEKVHSVLADRILDIVNEGLPLEPWARFAENVYANPAEFSRDELYLFLEKAQLPITGDGCFLAYKNVRADYLDIYTGTMDNSVGSIVEMPREDVDPNRYRTCSTGLHFASKDYLKHYGHFNGGRTVIVKINPKDVVSIPSDYDNTKGRCWRYEVVGEIPLEKTETVVWPSIVDDDDTDFDDDNWDEWSSEDEWTDEYDDDNDDPFVPPTPAPSFSNVNQTNPTKKGFLSWFRRS